MIEIERNPSLVAIQIKIKSALTTLRYRSYIAVFSAFTTFDTKNVGTTKLSANIATIPPGGVAYAHIHVGFEVILYIIEGKVRHEFGTGLKQVIENEAGDFIYIKPGVPHEVFNMSDTEPVVAFVARSSADEWDNIVPYDRNVPTEAPKESENPRSKIDLPH